MNMFAEDIIIVIFDSVEFSSNFHNITKGKDNEVNNKRSTKLKSWHIVRSHKCYGRLVPQNQYRGKACKQQV